MTDTFKNKKRIKLKNKKRKHPKKQKEDLNHTRKKIRNKRNNKRLTRKGGGILKDVAFKAESLVGQASDHIGARFLKGKDSNIFHLGTFIKSRDRFLFSLFMYLRYRNSIENRSGFLEKIYTKKNAPGRAFVDKKLVDAFGEMHSAINYCVEHSGLSRANMVCYKNCLCIAVIDSLRYINNSKIKSKEFIEVLEIITEAIKRTSICVKTEESFENKFRVKFNKFKKINFRLNNMYDYGFLFNMYYYGPYYHSNINRLDKAKNESDINKLKKEWDQKFKKIMRSYATYVIKKEHILPKPNKHNPLNYDNNEKRDIIEKLLEYDKKRPKNAKEFSRNGNIASKDLASLFLDDYLDDLIELEKLSYQMYSVDNDIDTIKNKNTLPVGFKKRIKDILKFYFEETNGLVRGENSITVDNIKSISGFNDKFNAQMEAINNECEFIYFSIST